MNDPLHAYAVLSLDPHADCTCCRQYRLVDQPTFKDSAINRHASGLERDSWEGLRPTPLLPPKPTPLLPW
jgi:hypothetical protein